MSFSFAPADRPFPRWLGPYSPARGKMHGFRFHNRRLGTWVQADDGRCFWHVRRSPGVAALEKLVLSVFHGGRVLLLPNGCIVKPLQGDDERGRRVYLGEHDGDILLEPAAGYRFNMADPGDLCPGDLWPGPTTTGIECVIQPNGSLACHWYHPAEYGRDMECHEMTAADPLLAKGFMLARKGEQRGRVRVTANGHVITNRLVGGSWKCFYVGQVDVGQWPHLDEWI